jgi:general secretion pathway protein D
MCDLPVLVDTKVHVPPGGPLGPPVPGYNQTMRWRWFILLIVALATPALCADQPQNLLLLPCAPGDSTTAPCNPSKRDLKEAKAAFSQGLKLEHAKRTEDAMNQFAAAARLSPKNVEYATALEMVRQQAVFDHLQRGNTQLLNGRQIEALAEFRSALNLDPENEFAQQRLRDALGEWAPTVEPAPVVVDSGELHVAPKLERRDFHYRGDGRALLTEVAAAYGIDAQFDDSVVARRVRFDIENVDFYTAMGAACDVTRTFWTPMAEKQILLASESPDNHRQFDRMSLRTFYVPGAASPNNLTDIGNALRTIFEVKFITLHPPTNTIEVRAPQRMLDAAAQFMQGLHDSRPQVMLDVRIYEISHSLVRDMGMHLPNNFNLFNIPAGALAALGGQSIQSLVNQLISGGGINQANSQGIAGLLAQLQSQQSSIFSQPLATFGGGLTFMGLSLDQFTAQLSLNESWVRSLQHASLRVAQGDETTFKIGTRFPILNASFAPISNSSAISQVLQNNTFKAPFPSFNYEDIGLNLRARPTVNANSDVGLQLEMQVRSLGTQSFNGVPVISNREYDGSITLADGEPAVVAGAITRDEQLSLGGIPGLGAVPGLNKVMVSNSKQVDEDELLVVITPHVVSIPAQSQSLEVWLAK